MAWNNSEEPRIRFIAPHLNELEIIADHLAYTDPTQLARLASPQTVIPTTRHPIGTLLVHHVVIYATGRP